MQDRMFKLTVGDIQMVIANIWLLSGSKYHAASDPSR